MHYYPDHRIIPDGTPKEARDRLVKIDEEFAQIRDTLNPLLDKYTQLSVERERLCDYRIPRISMEESEVLRTRAMEMVRMDPDNYLAPVVRALLAQVDSLEFHNISPDSIYYKEMQDFYHKHNPNSVVHDVPPIRNVPMDYADPRRR